MLAVEGVAWAVGLPRESIGAATGLIPSRELVHRVTGVPTSPALARIHLCERIPTRPLGIAYHDTDNLTALIARNARCRQSTA